MFWFQSLFISTFIVPVLDQIMSVQNTPSLSLYIYISTRAPYLMYRSKIHSPFSLFYLTVSTLHCYQCSFVPRTGVGVEGAREDGPGQGETNTGTSAVVKKDTWKQAHL